MRVRDSQRSKLYAWENATFAGKYGETMSLDECRVLAYEAIGRYGFTNQPAVKDGRGRRSAGANSHEIDLPKWARNRFVVLHEVAHTLTSLLETRHGVPRNSWAAHGAEYTRIFVSLLQAYGVEPKTGTGISIQSLARKAGLKVAPPGGLVPMPVTTWKRWRAAQAELTALAAKRKALVEALDKQRVALDGEAALLKDQYLRSAKAARGEANRAAADRRARGRALVAARGSGFGVPAKAAEEPQVDI
jgi:hypothetical protein